MRRYKRVEIEWGDASHYGREQSPEDIKTKCRLQEVKTIGYLVQRSRKVIKVAGELIEDGDMRDVSIIPRADIRRIIYLNEDE